MALTLVSLLEFFSALVLIVSTSSNSLLLLVFYRRPGLRTLSNRFVMNLLVTNLASSWILVPLTLWDSDLLSGWAPPMPAAVWHGLTGAVYAQSVLSVMTVAVDQYYAVTDPLRYHVTVNAASFAATVAITWCLSVLAGALSAVRELPVAPDVFRHAFPAAYAALLYVVPFVTVCVVYVKICTAAHRNSERARRNGSVPDQLQQQQQPLQQPQPQQQSFLQQQPQSFQQQQQPLQQQELHHQQQQQLLYNNNNNNNNNNNSSTSNNNVCNNEYSTIVPTIHEEEDEALEAVSLHAAVTYEPEAPSKPLPFQHTSARASLKSTSSSIVNHLRYRISNASMFRYREETRAAKISALVIVTAAACWTPYALLKLSQWSPVLGGRSIASPGPLVALLSLSAHAVITPVLFAHRNRRVHRELCRVFCRRKRCSSFYDNVRNATVASSAAAPTKSGSTAAAAGPQHVFGRWFGRPGGIRFGKTTITTTTTTNTAATTTSSFATAYPACGPVAAAQPPNAAVMVAAHLPTDTDMTRSSFSSNGSATTQASSVITVD